MEITRSYPDSAVSQLALLHRVSGIVSSDMSLQKMLNELIGLVVGVTNCDAQPDGTSPVLGDEDEAIEL